MTVTAEHQNSIGKADTVDTWRKTMRIAVPSREGHIVDLIIVAIYETTAVNGLPLDLLIDARKTVNDPVKQFGVVFSKNPPDWPRYNIPILWKQDGKSGVGRWR